MPASISRRYHPGQLDDARLICGLRAVGVPIDEVRAVVGQAAGRVRSVLDVHRARLVAQVREMSQQIAAVDEFIEKGTPMPAPQTVRPVQIRITVAEERAAAAFYTAARRRGLQGGKWVCSDITGPAMGGLQLNFTVGDDGTGGVGIEGQAGPDVTRLAYVPVRGAKPVDASLWPELPAPDMSEPAKMLPVVDKRSMTQHRFAVITNDASDAVLLAYDRDGHVVGTGGDKLHDR